jgi:ATP-dependent helicase/nuclease subunit A
MISLVAQSPRDQAERNRALAPGRSILVQAPAGSGKTDLLTRRFLRLLSEVDEPGQIVAITFTKAAVAEMRHRILSELERSGLREDKQEVGDDFSMETLARRALEHSQKLGWNLLDLPAQLRISTIDSFCRDLALQQPLLSGVGGNLQINEHPEQLYRRGARQTLEMIGSADSTLVLAIEALLLWRDNNWYELEELLVKMLGQRDRWMHDFVLQRDPDWESLREGLERPLVRAIAATVSEVSELLSKVPRACDEAMQLARFACLSSGGTHHQALAELADFPCGPFQSGDAFEEARQAYVYLAQLLLTDTGTIRKQVNKSNGFPKDRKLEKQRILSLLAELKAIPGLAAALDSVRSLPPARYTEEDWQIVRSCFTLLRHAAGQLKAVFAEAGTIDFIEVAQVAQQVLRGEDGFPTDAARALTDGISHLLVDEFQDTSRRQHQLLSSLVSAWSDQSGHTLFVVGDPMQSIYSFRDAEHELFARVRDRGLEVRDSDALFLDSLQLRANFRTEPGLVHDVNDAFTKIFEKDDGSGISFSTTDPAREPSTEDTRFQLHLVFIPQANRNQSSDSETIRAKREISEQCETARAAQVVDIVALIRSHSERMEKARKSGKKYRIAILGRTRKALAPISQALREAGISFRAVDLENLRDRPEILDALALARALLNPQDRVAWLGILRAPWCGLSLEELHAVAADTAATLSATTIPQLLAARLHLISHDSRIAVERLMNVFASVPRLRASLPTASLGTLLQQVWSSLGGESCTDATAQANLGLLWKLLDELPEGEQDLFGPTLNTALDALCALPNPAASSECGVQLMTIHKSKGLEFEVVVVPEMQAGTVRSAKRLLSWLERGLKHPDDSGDITEFLVAPLPSKGTDRGQTKAWVDRALREREEQETRRILYVAATRARDELHLFARPTFKYEADGFLSLAEPSNSLLATAWPALEENIRVRFEEWKTTPLHSGLNEDQVITAIAASAQGNLFLMPSPPKPTLLRRLPANFQFLSAISHPDNLMDQGLVGAGQPDSRERHEGGLISRALGTAVHRLLEELARLRTNLDWDHASKALAEMRPRITSQVRAAGVPPPQAASIAAQAFDYAMRASQDPNGRWILSPHAGAASEAAWAGVLADDLRLVRVDRIFRAGPEPLIEGDDTWWVIDFKTAHVDNFDPVVALPQFRAIFAHQLETYAAVLRNLHTEGAPLRAGIYYPRMSLFDWWEI